MYSKFAKLRNQFRADSKEDKINANKYKMICIMWGFTLKCLFHDIQQVNNAFRRSS